MQPNIPFGEKHHHTALRVETNQSRRRPTSWSLSKLPVFGLYLKLFARGSTFLTKLFSLFSLSFLSSLPTVLFGLKSSLESTFFFHMSTPHWLLGLPLSPYPSTTTRNMRISNEIFLPHKVKYCCKRSFTTKIILFYQRRLILVAKSFDNK